VDASFISYTAISIIEKGELATIFQQVKISGIEEKYSAYLASSSISVDTTLTFTDLGSLIFRERVAESQFVIFAEMVKSSLIKIESGKNT
jgi:hypothetical protein